MIYLNNAATTFPKPINVVESVHKCLDSLPCHSDRAGIDIEAEDIQRTCRNNLAGLFNSNNPQNIILTSGATESLNLAINGLPLKGRHVITTESEHNSVIRPLKHLERDGIISLSFAPCDTAGVVAIKNLLSIIRPDTALIVVNHCSNVTGNVNDIDAIAELCRQHGITFIVDASQSAGFIPIDLQKCPVDILVFAGHKYLYGMQGTGGLSIREGLKIKPLKVGGTGTRSDLLFMPEIMPVLFEAGTPNIPGIVSLNAGIEFILETGLINIIEKEKALAHYLVHTMCRIPEIILYGNYDIEPRSPVISFNIRNIVPEDVCYILQESFGIIVRSGLHCAPLIHKPIGSHPTGTVRISLSYFSTEEEIDFLGKALVQIAQSSRSK